MKLPCPLRTPLTLLAALAILAPGADAQVRRGRTAPEAPRWAPVALGVRVGWEQDRISNSGTALGAQLRLPVLRSGILEVVPSADIIFLRGPDKDYQYNLDVVFSPAGARGGVLVGAGVGWRDSLLAGLVDGDGRNTFFGYNLFLGGRTQLGPIQLALQIRWIFLNDTDYSPNSISLGLDLPFWRVSRGP